jgi:hypothetical protein
MLCSVQRTDCTITTLCRYRERSILELVWPLFSLVTWDATVKNSQFHLIQKLAFQNLINYLYLRSKNAFRCLMERQIMGSVKEVLNESKVRFRKYHKTPSFTAITSSTFPRDLSSLYAVTRLANCSTSRPNWQVSDQIIQM